MTGYDVRFHVDGLDALIARLASLEDETKYKGGRAALRKATREIEAVARANALQIDDPETAEQIAKNIAIRWNGRLFKRTGALGFRVGVLGGAKNPGKKLQELGELAGSGKANPGGDTWYWRLVEFGTSRMRAQPFMRPAMLAAQDRAASIFVREFNKAIDRAIRRKAKLARAAAVAE